MEHSCNYFTMKKKWWIFKEPFCMLASTNTGRMVCLCNGDKEKCEEFKGTLWILRNIKKWS